MWITGCVPELVLEVTERKKSSMVMPGSSGWRSLRPMNIFMFTDDSSLEVYFLEHKEMLLVDAAALPYCHTSLSVLCMLTSTETLIYQKKPMFQDFITN